MNVRPLLWAVPVAATMALLGATNLAEAQTVVVQGQVQVDPYGRPLGTAQAPPGYGVQGQVYVQPAQPQYGPQYAPQYVQQQPQVRYVEQTSSIKGLWIPGIIIFGVSWALTGVMGSSLSFDSDYQTWSWVPLVGPWVALSYANNDTEATGSLIGGIAQAAGLAMFILGISIQRTVRVATYAFGREDDQAPELAFDVLPAAGGGQLGLTLSHF